MIWQLTLNLNTLITHANSQCSDYTLARWKYSDSFARKDKHAMQDFVSLVQFDENKKIDKFCPNLTSS